MPKSYLSNEPAAMRAVLSDFDPHVQVTKRIRSLDKQGHDTDKIELIVLGGTFSSYRKDYRTEFIKGCFDAANEQESESLDEAHKINETADNRVIGVSLETRPDYVTQKEMLYFRELGCTKVQIGVQHTDNKILDINKRGHHIESSIEAIKLIKDIGSKIAIHLMPNLPGSSPEKDYDMVKEAFDNPGIRPDHLKLYPCVVTPYSELETWWEDGKYKSYSDAVLMDLVIKCQQLFPRYLRVERLIRDIPGESILEGSKMTNMRQVAENKMKELGIICECIRCREIKGAAIDPNKIQLNVDEFDASEGKEFFLSYDDMEKDKICSLLRLRFHSYSFNGKPHFIKELEGAALVREIHTYGKAVPIGQGSDGESQHVGMGRSLLAKAEDISKKNGFNKVAVIAGIGTREYYRKWGYELEGTYMTKLI